MMDFLQGYASAHISPAVMRLMIVPKAVNTHKMTTTVTELQNCQNLRL
jgi:hypothetical protein